MTLLHKENTCVVVVAWFTPLRPPLGISTWDYQLFLPLSLWGGVFHNKTTTTTDPNNNKKKNESNDSNLAQREDQMVTRSKALVGLILLLATAAVATVTNLYTKNEEMKDFQTRVSCMLTCGLFVCIYEYRLRECCSDTIERRSSISLSISVSLAPPGSQTSPYASVFVQFDDFANQIISVYQINAKNIISSFEGFSLHVTTSAIATNVCGVVFESTSRSSVRSNSLLPLDPSAKQHHCLCGTIQYLYVERGTIEACIN